MRKLTFLVGLVAATALVSTACVEKIDTIPDGGSGGTAGSGGTGGGGDTGVHDELYGSGSRLSAVYLDGGDGADQFLHFYDADLDMSCSIAETDDGTTRCVPAAKLGRLSYTDAGCSTAVVVEGACDTAVPDYFSIQPDVACAVANINRLDAYAKGATATATNIYYMDAAGNCVEDTTYDDTTDVVYEVAAADATTFAEATLGQVEADGGLGQLVATVEDGAYQVLGAYNVARDENCGATAVGDETLCLSSNLAYGLDLSNTATCDEDNVASASTDASCGEPQAIIAYTNAADVCDPPTTALHAVGDEVVAADVYTDATGTCEAVTDTDSRYFEIGGAAMEGVVPSLAEATAGTGRLTLSRMTTPDGAPVAQGAALFTDTERMESCYRASTVSGDKCLPLAPVYASTGTGYFSDDLCTVQVISAPVAVCATAPPTYIGYYEASTNTCAATSVETMHEVGAAYTGTVYQDVAGTCTAGVFDGIDFYEVGAEVALTEFADLSEVTQAASSEDE